MKDLYKRFIMLALDPLSSMKEEELALDESVVCSWLCVVIEKFWFLLEIFILHKVVDFHLKMLVIIIMIIFICLPIVLHPLYVWLYCKLWQSMMAISSFRDHDEGVDLRRDQIITCSMVSSLFLVIPVFGKMIQRLTSLFYIYLGLRIRLKYTRMQSVGVILTPCLLLIVLVLCMLCFFFILLNMI